jgi:integrase
VRDYRLIEMRLSDWKGKPFRDITPAMVLERFNTISAQINRLGSPKHTSANKTMRGLRLMIDNYIAEHPDCGIRNPVDVMDRRGGEETAGRRRSGQSRYHRSNKRKDWIPTIKDGEPFVRWWTAVHQEKRQTIIDYIETVLFLGGRGTETAELTWASIDFAGDKINYWDTKNHRDYAMPMTRHVRAIMKRRHEDEDKHKEWVFPAARPRFRGKPVSYITVPPNKAVQRIRKRSGVEFTMHDLRRTFVNSLKLIGVEERMRSNLMKHAEGDVTAGYEDEELLRREWLQKLEDHLLTLVKKANGKNDKDARAQ